MVERAFGPEEGPEILDALAEQLAAAGASFELVVIGGAALVTLGLVQRVTRDVDVLALVSGGMLVSADPLPPALVAALARLARDFGLPDDWLNAEAAGLLDFGLPEGFMTRVSTAVYGPALTIHFASRPDQIHFKLYALVDNGAAKHQADLNALEPTHDELLAAARWTRTHDPSEGFRQMLVATLRHLGVHDADVGP